ncbi:MAG TPA: MFS transporter [Ktedonobacteraceae bacterium]
MEVGRTRVYTPAMLLLILIVGISFMGLGFMMPLRAAYGRQIGASSIELGFMASVFLLAAFCASPFVGELADRFGYRRILAIGLFCHMLLMLAYILVQNPFLLIALRIVEGIASASVLPPARALVNVMAPSTRQGEALGVISAAQAVGILLGPMAGTVLASAVSYELAFLLAGVSLGLAFVAALFLPGVERDSEAGEHDFSLLHFRGLFTRPLLLAYLLQLVQQGMQGVLAAVWTIYMLDRGASLPVIGLTFVTFALPLVVLTPLIGRLSDRYGRYHLTVVGLLLYSVIYIIYSLQLSPFWLVIMSVVEGLAVSIIQGGVNGLLADVTPGGVKGKVQANFNAAGTLGGFFGATVAGFLYAWQPGIPFAAAGIVGLLALTGLFVPAVVRLFPTMSSAPQEVMEDGVRESV